MKKNSTKIKVLENTSPLPNFTLNLKLKFQGITKQPPSQFNQIKSKIFFVYPSGKKSCGETTLISDEKGIWNGSVTTWGAQSPCVAPYAGKNIKLFIKGEKHLQKRFYITLPLTDNNLDFSGLYFLAGDLPPQDGVVNSYDASLIKSCLNKNDSNCLKTADLNLDDIVNAADFSLIIETLPIGKDEE